MKRTVVRYRRRETRELVDETIFSERALRWFYEDPIGARVFETALNRPWFSWLYGRLQDLPSSRRKIPEFVSAHAIAIDEIEGSLASFGSFNAFFSRRLRPGARPFPKEPEVFGSPADGKVLVFPTLAGGMSLPVKGADLALGELLASESHARAYQGGSALVVRLAPYDYHRFHFSDDGAAGPVREIPGRYHSVSPIATARVPDVFCRNKRTVTMFRSEHFGNLCLVEVGALTVGTIVQTFDTDRAAQRGEEKGYFRFGGSTIVVLFEPGAIAFDQDLIEDSAAGMEVQVHAGSSIAMRR